MSECVELEQRDWGQTTRLKLSKRSKKSFFCLQIEKKIKVALPFPLSLSLFSDILIVICGPDHFGPISW